MTKYFTLTGLLLKKNFFQMQRVEFLLYHDLVEISRWNFQFVGQIVVQYTNSMH